MRAASSAAYLPYDKSARRDHCSNDENDDPDGRIESRSPRRVSVLPQGSILSSFRVGRCNGGFHEAGERETGTRARACRGAICFHFCVFRPPGGFPRERVEVDCLRERVCRARASERARKSCERTCVRARSRVSGPDG